MTQTEPAPETMHQTTIDDHPAIQGYAPLQGIDVECLCTRSNGNMGHAVVIVLDDERRDQTRFRVDIDPEADQSDSMVPTDPTLGALWLALFGPTIHFRIGDGPERELVAASLALPCGLLGYPITRYLRRTRNARLREARLREAWDNPAWDRPE